MLTKTDNRRAPYDFNKVVKLDPKSGVRNFDGKVQITNYKFVTPSLETPVTVRVYEGRSRNASTVYASVWFRSKDGETYGSGSGAAGGYGYHKVSGAVDDAFRNAGVTLERDFHGCGESPIIHAVTALARKLGYRAGKVI